MIFKFSSSCCFASEWHWGYVMIIQINGGAESFQLFRLQVASALPQEVTQGSCFTLYCWRGERNWGRNLQIYFHNMMHIQQRIQQADTSAWRTAIDHEHKRCRFFTILEWKAFLNFWIGKNDKYIMHVKLSHPLRLPFTNSALIRHALWLTVKMSIRNVLSCADITLHKLKRAELYYTNTTILWYTILLFTDTEEFNSRLLLTRARKLIEQESPAYISLLSAKDFTSEEVCFDGNGHWTTHHLPQRERLQLQIKPVHYTERKLILTVLI